MMFPEIRSNKPITFCNQYAFKSCLNCAIFANISAKKARRANARCQPERKILKLPAGRYNKTSTPSTLYNNKNILNRVRARLRS